MSDNYKKYVSGYSEAGCKYDVPTREFFENTIPLVKCYQFENKVILKDNPTKVNEYSLNDNSDVYLEDIGFIYIKKGMVILLNSQQIISVIEKDISDLNLKK